MFSETIRIVAYWHVYTHTYSYIVNMLCYIVYIHFWYWICYIPGEIVNTIIADALVRSISITRHPCLQRSGISTACAIPSAVKWLKKCLYTWNNITKIVLIIVLLTKYFLWKKCHAEEMIVENVTAVADVQLWVIICLMINLGQI